MNGTGTAGPRRIAIVEQSRGLAALAVAWFHLTNGYKDWVAQTGSLGWLGVEVFFVISGFVIPLSLAADWQRQGMRAVPLFLARRIVRIEPPYLLSVLLVVAINLAAMRVPGFQGKVQTYPVDQIALHAAYLVPLSGYDWLQPVYWTLAYEFVFYLAVAGLIGVLAGRARWPALVLVAGLLGGIAGQIVPPLPGLFVMGCLVFRAHGGLDPAWLAICGIALAGLSMLAAGKGLEAFAGVITAALLISPQLARGVTGLAGRALGWLGTISFSLYLLHVPIGGKVVNLGQRWLSGPGGHLLLSALALAVSLVAAMLFWRFVERPCIAAARRIAIMKPHSANAETVKGTP